MPVSGNEEIGVKPLARQSGLDISGVPIKKRRFLRPSSPPPEEQSSHPVEHDSVPNVHGSASQEFTPSNASVAASTFGLFNTHEVSVPGETNRVLMNTVQTDSNMLAGVKTEETSLPAVSDSVPKFGNQGKLAVEDKAAENVLNLGPNKPSALGAGKEIFGQQVTPGKCKSEMSTVSVTPKSALGLKELNFSALVDSSKAGKSLNRENVEPISLNLSLGKVANSAQCKMDGVKSDAHTAEICANRSNWDLNTTMDAWEGSVTDASGGKATAEGLNTVGVTHDVKPVICSTGIVGIGMTTEKKFLEESERRCSFARTSSESAPLASEDSLHLQLSSSFLSFHLRQEPSSSAANKDSWMGFANMSLPRGFSVGNHNRMNSMTVKSEPFDESLGHGFGGASANTLESSGLRAVKRESFDPETKLSHCSVLKPVDPRSIKSEPLQEGNPEPVNMIVGTSLPSSEQVLQVQDNRGQTKGSTTEKVLHCQLTEGQSADKQAMQGQGTGGQPAYPTGEVVLKGEDAGGQPACSTDKQLLHCQVTGGNSTDKQVIQGQDTGGQPAQAADKLVFQGEDAGGHPASSMDKQDLQGQDAKVQPTSSTELSVSANEPDQLEHAKCAEGADLSKKIAEDLRSAELASSTEGADLNKKIAEDLISGELASSTEGADLNKKIAEDLRSAELASSTELSTSSRKSEQLEHSRCADGADCSRKVAEDVNSARLSSSTELLMSGSKPDQIEQSMCAEGADLSKEVPKEVCESAGLVTSEMVSLPVDHSGKEVYESSITENKNVDNCEPFTGEIANEVCDTAVTQNKNVDNPEPFAAKTANEVHSSMNTEEKNADNPRLCKSELMDQLPLDTNSNGEGPVSDEEKVNLSGDMIEEESYGSEYESDGNSVPMDIEEDARARYGCEDGEVRESSLQTVVKVPTCEEMENVNHVDSDNVKASNAETPGGDRCTSFHAKEVDCKIEDPLEASTWSEKECHVTIDDAEKDASMEGLPPVGMPTFRADQMEETEAVQGKPLELGKNDALKGQWTEETSDLPSSEGQGTLVDFARGSDDTGKLNNEEKNDSASPKVEASLNTDDGPRDASGGNRSRIINLSLASAVTSPDKSRPLSDKLLQSRPGRERLLKVPLEGDKLYPRGRDDFHYDGSYRYSRERHQDHSFRNPRFNYSRGRGRYSREALRGDRDSDRQFPVEFCNGPSDFGVQRHKYASAVAEPGTEFVNFSSGHNGPFVGNVRGREKLLGDETSVFHHLPSRRRSPGGREGPPPRGRQMVRRVPRSIGEEGSEVVGPRHNQKIIRGFTDDTAEHRFTRPHPPYEGLDGHFPSVQRRALPQIRSKSPLRSRSPVRWPSSRRRSPDGFGGPPELAHRRSPQLIYRMERIRSPDHPSFSGEMMVRGHGSPTFLSRPNDLREMDPGRDHGHPRSVISNRSPTNRVLFRNNKRFGVSDPRERTDGDEFVGGPMPSARLHELGGDGNGEDRRRFGERRGPFRTFRSPFNNDNQNFHFSAEDGSRPFRYFSEGNPEFQDRANLKEREFDRRINNRPGNAPSRQRGIDEQEENYRYGGRVLVDEGFDEISRMKRKRF